METRFGESSFVFGRFESISNCFVHFSATQRKKMNNARRACHVTMSNVESEPVDPKHRGREQSLKRGREGDRLEGNRTGPPIMQQRNADLGSNSREEECHELSETFPKKL